jgi:hypothetical protein
MDASRIPFEESPRQLKGISLMDSIKQIQGLQNNALVIQQLLVGVSEDLARWKPEVDEWCMLEVINHLYDEELLNFPAHLKEVLEGKYWTPIDPAAWVKEHGYAQKEWAISVQAFLSARETSVQWLENNYDSWDLEKRIDTPFGSLSAGDIFHSWLAHDFLHLRQLIQLHYQYAAVQAAPYQVRYAGEW